MSVAEQTASPKAESSPQAQLAASSFVGAVYLLVCLQLIFGALPTLWSNLFRQVVDDAGVVIAKPILEPFLSGALLLLTTIAALVVFGVVSYRLDKQLAAIKGHRAGIYVASLFLFVAVWATFSIGNRMEAADLPHAVGVGVTVLLGGVFLFGILWLFRTPGMYNFLLGFEEQGWFHAVSFKPNQGFKVRRGTVIALLFLGLSGIITLITHKALGSGTVTDNDWYLNIPFTAVGKLKAEKKADADKKPEAEKKAETEAKVDGDKKPEAEKKADEEQGVARIPPRYIPLLSKVHVTVPLFLGIGLVWFAWRITNWPVFADFLIATEAEINKVSWTTRKRLVQDTIVVLVTVFLLTTFLFVVDIVWIKILSNPIIDVLKVDVGDVQRKAQEKSQW